MARRTRPHGHVAAIVTCLFLIGICCGPVPTAAAQPYKDRRVVEVLRDFQRQGVRVIFSSALVTPDMRVREEPHGADSQDIISAILAPHDLTIRVGLRGILLVVRVTSVVEPNVGRRVAANAKGGTRRQRNNLAP
jgi:hypothetical protein